MSDIIQIQTQCDIFLTPSVVEKLVYSKNSIATKFWSFVYRMTMLLSFKTNKVPDATYRERIIAARKLWKIFLIYISETISS